MEQRVEAKQPFYTAPRINVQPPTGWETISASVCMKYYRRLRLSFEQNDRFSHKALLLLGLRI
jgi:hypothetical protein